MSNTVVYEHPLNERTRICLRLEHLFGKLRYFLQQDSEWATRVALDVLLDLFSVTQRNDVCSEVLKELERYIHVLEQLSTQADIDGQALRQILRDLERTATQLQMLVGQTAPPLRDSEFLKNVGQRRGIPGGDCNFDLPQYHHWLNQPVAQRQRQFQDWTRDLSPLREGVNLLLSLLRGSSDPRTITAALGFFQDNLDPQLPVQLLRVGLDSLLPVFPEISGHRHRFTIRFMELIDKGRPMQTGKTVIFQFTRCML